QFGDICPGQPGQKYARDAWDAKRRRSRKQGQGSPNQPMRENVSQEFHGTVGKKLRGGREKPKRLKTKKKSQ
ncbi:hypothetical protein KI387_008531, partial [Taxus chinensis]